MHTGIQWLTDSAIEQIHETGLFLPFHCLYVHAVEKVMKERCGYTGAFPYWDWTIGACTGIGLPVVTRLAHHVPHVLRRNFTLQPFLPFAGVPVFTNTTQYANESFTPERVRALVEETPPGDFVGFQFAMEEPQVSEGRNG